MHHLSNFNPQDFLFRDKTHYHSPVIDSPVDKYSYLGMAVSITFLTVFVNMHPNMWKTLEDSEQNSKP